MHNNINEHGFMTTAQFHNLPIEEMKSMLKEIIKAAPDGVGSPLCDLPWLLWHPSLHQISPQLWSEPLSSYIHCELCSL